MLLTVRLAGSQLTSEGRLEVYYNSQWGTVCDDYFDDKDATVFCRSLGFDIIVVFAKSLRTLVLPRDKMLVTTYTCRSQ